MARVALLYHPDCQLHFTGHHPESPARLEAIEGGLKECGLLSQLIQPSVKEATENDLRRVHQPRMIETARQACERPPAYLDPDTPVSEGSLRAALLAAGAGITAAHGVMAGEYDRAFCMVRPPGHHAGRWRSSGFCLFNNIAVATAYLLDAHQINRILIVDFDVHHGNGTQEIFYDTGQVYFLSAHMADHYPYVSGFPTEVGEGSGEGCNRNVPFPAGTPAKEYLDLVGDAVRSVAREYKPQFVLISAGFDSHGDDPLGGIRLGSEDFGTLTRIIVEAAESVNARGPISFLEGGYSLPALAASAAEHVRALLGNGNT